MKKIFCVLLAFIIIFCNIYGAYASFASPIVQRLVSSAAMVGTGGSITLPALIRGTTSGGGSVSSWITLAIPGGNVAKIAGAIIGIGAGLAFDYAFLKGAEYLASKNITQGTNGTITQTTSSMKSCMVNFAVPSLLSLSKLFRLCQVQMVCVLP